MALGFQVPRGDPARHRRPDLLVSGGAKPNSYELTLGLPSAAQNDPFVLGPEIKEEVIWVGPKRSPATTIADRGCVGGLGSPRSGAIGKPVKTEVIVKGEPKNPSKGDNREERRRRDPTGFDLAERLDRYASCRCHFTQTCLPACITQSGTEASTAFDLPGLQRVSNHARMIIPV